MLELYLLLIFMIMGAVIAVQVENLLSSVIAVGAVGFGLCMAFLFLEAPDLALTQLVVEIVILIVLIRATLAKEIPGVYKKREVLAAGTVILFMIMFVVFSFYAFKALPPFGAPIMKVAKTYIAEGFQKTGAGNLVTSVILDFRAYDTLGEATVLFVAIVGAIAVLRQKGRKEVTEEDRE